MFSIPLALTLSFASSEGFLSPERRDLMETPLSGLSVPGFLLSLYVLSLGLFGIGGSFSDDAESGTDL